jgi:phenylacetyl-CoA:acceptor oxidoreductase subunit 1
MTRWGMVVDLRRCVGCQACAIACKQANDVLPDRWRKVVDCGVGEAPRRERIFLHLFCQHCEQPPCLAVCPTEATYRRPDGIVAIDYETCVGCGYCIVACPYEARTISHRRDNAFRWGLGHVAEDLGSGLPNPEHVGVCTKCHFCQQRIDAGLQKGLQPGVDPEATPACVVICSSEALHFGDLDDVESEVSQLIGQNRPQRMLERLETDPAIYYIVD